MSKTVKKIWNIITTVVVVLAVLLAVALVGVRLIGYDVYMVLSGSMEPNYHVGSLIYVKEVDCTQLEVDDVITYMIKDERNGNVVVVTHRIVEVLIDEEDPTIRRFFVKGDANELPDPKSVHCENVIGTPVVSIPYLGYVANYIQNPPGMYVAIAAGAVLLLLMFLPDIFGSDDKNKKKTGEENAIEPQEENPGKLPEMTVEEILAEVQEKPADPAE